MAEVKRDVERVVTETVTFKLTLNAREALTVYAILGRVRGPLDGPRQHATAIFRALEHTGIAVIDDGSIQALGDGIRLEGEK